MRTRNTNWRKGIWLSFVPYLPRACHCNPESNLLFVFAGIVFPRVHHSLLLRQFIWNSMKCSQKHLRLLNVCGGVCTGIGDQKKPSARRKIQTLCRQRFVLISWRGLQCGSYYKSWSGTLHSSFAQSYLWQPLSYYGMISVKVVAHGGRLFLHIIAELQIKHRDRPQMRQVRGPLREKNTFWEKLAKINLPNPQAPQPPGGIKNGRNDSSEIDQSCLTASLCCIGMSKVRNHTAVIALSHFQLANSSAESAKASNPQLHSLKRFYILTLWMHFVSELVTGSILQRKCSPMIQIRTKQTWGLHVHDARFV